jgi:hypothetical protein
MSTLRTPLSQRIARRMWRAAGQPERVAGDPTCAYLGWYEDRAAEVLAAVADAGLVVRPRKRAAITKTTGGTS